MSFFDDPLFSIRHHGGKIIINETVTVPEADLGNFIDLMCSRVKNSFTELTDKRVISMMKDDTRITLTSYRSGVIAETTQIPRSCLSEFLATL